MQRDFVGYGISPPKFVWPHDAKLAINFVINYEEGGEHNILDGDQHSESYLIDFPGVAPLQNERSYLAESLFEYGSRCGIWRLLRLFDEFSLPLTFFATGLALERNPSLIQYIKESKHEIAGHGYRWIDYKHMDESTEREHIEKTLSIIKTLTGKSAKGWYTGRRSANTRNLIAAAGVQYDSESYSDDLPYWVTAAGRNHLVIPYSLETNDARYTLCPGWNTPEDCFHTLKGAFDQLYREGAQFSKMMSVGLHPRLSGRPARCDALRRFIKYIVGHENIWICTREQIADFWYHQHPNKA